MVTRLRENDNKHAAALQKEKDEVSRLKRELAKVQEERANYEKAVAAADKQELREKLEMAEVSTTSAVEAFDALEAKRARWLIELNRINHEMDSKFPPPFLLLPSNRHITLCR